MKMTEFLVVRRAVVEDVAAIVSFNRSMALETEGKELPAAVITAGVEGLFRRPEYGFYLVAEAGAAVVGCLLVTFEWSDWRNGLMWWIQSVYVDSEWRGRGVSRRLYERVKALAAGDGGVRGFRLYVEKENLAAQRAYAALGMEETCYKLFEDLV